MRVRILVLPTSHTTPGKITKIFRALVSLSGSRNSMAIFMWISGQVLSKELGVEKEPSGVAGWCHDPLTDRASVGEETGELML